VNFLAHAYLSFGDPGLIVGNMVSDFVKGASQHAYPEEIRKGIRLHRAIDAYTDAHPATLEAKQVFRADYRLYATAFVDVVYDHFLASDTERFTDDSLSSFVDGVYRTLDAHEILLPQRFAAILPWMKSQNWLYNYRFTWGLEKSFGGLVRRARYLDDSLPAMRLFEAHHGHLLDCYRAFMPEVRSFAAAFES
jgi:acyl carrier protein phosphodiesterase